MMRSFASAVKKWLGGSLALILALGGMTGCQPTFLSKETWEQAHSATAMLPPSIENSHNPPTAAITPEVKAPPTVNFPEREQREMTLPEAIAIALETGLVSGNAPEGVADTTLARFQGPGSLNAQTDAIRVLALNPAIAQASIEASLARFDAVWVTNANATSVDAIPGVPNLPGTNGTVQQQGTAFGSSVIKAFADGGVANVSFLVNYRNITNTGGEPAAFFGPFNPQYSARLSLGYEIPLWRDAGVEINSLLPHLSGLTGSSITDGPALVGFNGQQGRVSSLLSQPVEGTLVSRLRFDQSRAEFERNVQTMVKNVEIAYWTLYNKYGQLYSFEENLRILQRAYQEIETKEKAGAQGADKFRLYQNKGQFEEFRGDRIQALQEVLAAERELRGLLGMLVEDGKRIVPITPPSLAEIKPDWQTCLQDALTLRPELVLARENVRYHQYLLTIQKNGLRPDLRAFLKYEPFGDGPSLLGASPAVQATDPFNGIPIPTDSAFRSLAGGHLTDFTAGVFMNVPLGFRYELAAIRTARLQLSQSYYFLRDQEDRAVRYLTQQYQETQAQWNLIQVHRYERMSYRNALLEFEKKIKIGAKDATYGNLDFLTIQRSYAAALVKEYGAIAEYNNALARLEFAKGTTLKYNNVYISEGALPQCAQVRAVEYEKRQTQALKLCQRPDSLAHPGRMCASKESEVLTPKELPAVTVTEGPDSMPPAVLPAPPVAEGKSTLQKAPITPASLPVIPSPAKVEYKPASVPGPINLPAPTSSAKPVESPGTPLFLQQTSNLQDFGANYAEARPVVAAPITARGALGDLITPR